MLEQIIEINGAVNAEIRYLAEPPGYDHWQTPQESGVLGTGDCEDIATSKYFRLREQGFEPELLYCLWDNPRTLQRLGHLVCLVGLLVLDNIDTEVKTLDERPDLTPVYGIGHKGLRNWRTETYFPLEQHGKFAGLLERIQQGE